MTRMQAVFNGTVVAESDRTRARRIKDHVAFWQGVEVRPTPAQAEK